jgi:hypothetical protein
MRCSVSLEQTVVSGDYRASLTALRDFLARELDDCDSKRDAATLAARLQAVLADIEAIPKKSEVSAADEIAARRASRRTGSTGTARA